MGVSKFNNYSDVIVTVKNWPDFGSIPGIYRYTLVVKPLVLCLLPYKMLRIRFRPWIFRTPLGELSQVFISAGEAIPFSHVLFVDTYLQHLYLQ